ncbi:ABC transporter permease [Anaeromyxobacter terrae]|uniref:ABC transporter permease n=1 Tax=Anaeromyxobacter terrae TaxID=2925406 RepID=UPI001F598367|nr:ABC transporter permease subunit [Anaeromyxobacter sp. SG22]
MSAPTRLAALALVARQEIALAVRSRWTAIFAAVFALLAVGVAASGYILSGGSGFEDFARTSVSLVQLVVLVVPLAALVMGVLAVAPERGTAELLFSQPIGRGVVLLGQLAGLFVALSAAELIGFGAAGLVVFLNAGEEGAGAYFLLVLGAILLTAVFLAIAALVGAGAVGRKRVRALALALVVWFAATVLVDVAALGIATLLRSTAASRLLVASVVLNPASAIRVGSLLAVQGTAAFGAASLALLRLTGGPVGAALLLGASVLAWIVLPVAAAIRRLGHIDL